MTCHVLLESLVYVLLAFRSCRTVLAFIHSVLIPALIECACSEAVGGWRCMYWLLPFCMCVCQRLMVCVGLFMAASVPLTYIYQPRLSGCESSSNLHVAIFTGICASLLVSGFCVSTFGTVPVCVANAEERERDWSACIYTQLISVLALLLPHTKGCQLEPVFECVGMLGRHV